MTTKKVTATNKTEKSTHNVLTMGNEKDIRDEVKFAKVILSPRTHNAVTIKEFSKKYGNENADISALMEVLLNKANDIKNGDLSDLEGRLAAQTIVLDVMFNEMAGRAAANVGTHMAATEIYMRMALKAQAQCAKTVEILATMKNPPVVFAKQMNVANNQQVNNGTFSTNTHERAHAGETINQSNELLKKDNHATLDSRGTTTTSGADKAMAAVETQHRRDND
jgi:hypothetical protein